jgi:hypothetical protein
LPNVGMGSGSFYTQIEMTTNGIKIKGKPAARVSSDEYLVAFEIRFMIFHLRDMGYLSKNGLG